MNSIDKFRDRLRDLLIEKNGDLVLSEEPDLIRDAKVIGLDKTQLVKLLQEVDAGINWEYIRQQKENGIQREQQYKDDIETQKKKQENAEETLGFIIEQCSKDKVFAANQVKAFFETSDELSQLESVSAQLLRSHFNKNNFVPLTTPKGLSLRQTLESTDWHKDALPPTITGTTWVPPTKNIIKVSTFIFIISAGLTFILNNMRGSSDKKAETLFCSVDYAALRSSKENGSDHNYVRQLEYGDSVVTYSRNDKWSYVKAGGVKGYVLNDYLLPKKEFIELNSIFGDEESKRAISTVICRKALLKYYVEHDIMGKIEPQIQKEIYGSEQKKEVWQIFSTGRNIKPNTVLYSKLTNPSSNVPDFACIIKNIGNGKRKLLYFSFNNSGDAHLEEEQEAPTTGYISSISLAVQNGKNHYEPSYIYY